MEIKKCNRCLEIKPFNDFFKDSSHSTGRYSICKPCKKQATYKWRLINKEKYNGSARQWRKNNPKNVRKFYLKRRFGITLETYETMLAEQNGGCKICGRQNTKNKRLAVDHCHNSKKIRGILCDNCNKGLGSFQDSAALLEKAKQYLEGY